MPTSRPRNPPSNPRDTGSSRGAEPPADTVIGDEPGLRVLGPQVVLTRRAEAQPRFVLRLRDGHGLRRLQRREAARRRAPGDERLQFAVRRVVVVLRGVVLRLEVVEVDRTRRGAELGEQRLRLRLVLRDLLAERVAGLVVTRRDLGVEALDQLVAEGVRQLRRVFGIGIGRGDVDGARHRRREGDDLLGELAARLVRPDLLWRPRRGRRPWSPGWRPARRCCSWTRPTSSPTRCRAATCRWPCRRCAPSVRHS